MTPRVRDRLVLAIWTLSIFAGGSLKLPPAPIDAPALGWDKYAHALGFFLTQRIAERALRHESEGAGFRTALAAALVSIFLGGLLEVYQAALPHRSADVWDFVADSIGALAAIGWSALVARGQARAENREKSG